MALKIHKPFMTAAEVAKLLMCCPATVRRYRSKGLITGVQVNCRRYLYHSDSVYAVLAERKTADR